MSTKRRTEEEALAANKELEKKAAESAERIREDGGVWKVTLEDQAKYEAEHRKKKAAKASGAVSSKAGAAGGGYTPGAYYGGTDASAVKGKAGKTGAVSSGMSTGALKAALRRENDLQTAYRDYVQEAEAQAARQAKTPAMQRLKERKKAEIETAFDDYAENGLKDMYKAALEREVKQAREDEARNALFAEKALAEKSRENVRKANSSALEKARNSSVAKSGSAADFYKNRSETMGRGVIGDLENLEKIKNRDLGAELKLEGQKLKYQWEEAGRRYDALSEEQKRALYRRRNSSAIDRARMSREEGGLGGRTAQETRNRISNDIYERYKKLDEESRDPAKAEKYAFINRLRSAAGEGVENLGLWLYETFGYEPGKETYDRGEARAIGEVANEQVQRLVDAAPSQLGKDLVKVSDSVAQQLSYKILTAPISLFGGSIIADKVLSNTGNLAAAEKAARDFTGGTYTAGMASSSAADKYVQCRAEGQGKLEASVRAMGTGLISYFSESLGGIGGSKSPLGGLEEKYAESLIGSILYNAFEEGGEEFVEYLGDYLLDGAVDLAARGEWQQEWSWEEVIENAKIGAMSGGLFGGYNKLQNAVYSRIDEANAIRLEKAAREYSDYMKNAYRLMNDPNLREIAERRIGDTAIPSAMRTASRETGEMNFGNVLKEKPGTVSAEQMYGVKLSQENKNEDFAEWAEKEDAEKVTNGQQIEENASYSRKIDNIESLSEGGYIPVGRVLKGSALNNIGLASTNIYFDKSKIVKSLDEHSDHITKEVLKQIPQILNEPMVITEANADNTVNVFGNVYIGSSPLMVGVMVTKSRDGKTEINKIRTVHARRDAGKKITDSSVLYLNPNIEKTQTWFQALGNDVPLGGTKFGFIRRITDKLKKVNSENQAAKGTELKIKKEPDSRGIDPSNRRYDIGESNSETGDVPSPNANIPQNGNSVNTLDAENSAAKAQQNSENAAKAQQRKPGTVSAEQMYGVKLSQENKNEDFAEWAEKEDAKKKKAAEEAANAVEQSYEDFKKNLPAEGEKKPIKVSPYTTIKSPYEGESPNKKAETKSERVTIPAESFEEGKRIYETRRKGAGQPGIVSEVKKALTNILNSIGGQHAVVSNNTEFGIKPYEVMVNMNVAGKLAGDPNPSAEKFAVLKNIDSIIENAAYVGSGDYVRHGTKNKNVTRYDYFETEVNINGKPYVVAFDVEVVPGKNNYRTHKVLNEINLMETSTGETRPRRVAEDATPGLQGTNSALSVESSPRLDAQGTESSSLGDVPSPNANIPQNGNSVNTLDAENSAAKAQQNSENAAKVQQRKPGTVSAEQMYGVKLSQENKNEDFAEWAEKEDAKKKKAAEKEAILAEKQNNADSRSIRTDMTDDERYEALKNEKIKIEPYNSEKLKGENIEELSSKPFKEAKKYIKTLAEKFEVFKKYASEKAKVEFNFSRNNLIESEAKQKVLTPEYAEMLSATDAIVQNAVLVEAHKDKYAGTTREDKTLLQTDVLLSAFADENGIVPVRLTVKEFKDKENSLYALITLEKIETEIVGRGESLATTPTPYPVSEMSIPDIVSKIKPTDGKILKYLPDKLLNAEQLEGKRAALAKDKGRIEGFSQKGDFAAKAQQAETEEEARLRTLYESEPTGKYAGTEAGESKAELDEKVKEAKENAVGDDELKKKPKTEKQKILKRRIEKAGLDMTVEEIVGFAQGLGRIKGFFGSERKDFARIFDDVSEGSRTIRNDLHKLLEVPHRQAQAQYTESYKNAVKAISDKFAELGIKAGSKESAAVQRIGEHAYQIDSKGNTAEYTYEMLKRDFPDSWEKIAEAAKFTRNIYDDYLKKLNAMYESIYPQTVEKAEERRSKLNAEAQKMSDYKDSLNEVKKALRENVDKKKAALAKSKDGTQKKADLKRQIATLEARMKAVDSKMAAADSRAFAAKLKSELIKSQIENGEILKNKQIKPRQDYFRHFQELNSNFAELTDIFTNDQNISPGLIGVSAETKPRTMWSSIAQARAKTHAYTEDAVGGLLKYAQTAETLLAYNPLISRYRDISAVIRTAAVMADEKVSGTGTNASRFAAYLDDWTNNIAGKSYVLDRYFERAGTNGRAILKAFEKINGIVKKGSLLHNVMSSAKQISNLPYASAYIPNPKDWISGAIASAESQFGKTETANALREARSQSGFMNERYLDNSIDKLTRAIMNDGIKEKNERFGAAMLGALDRAAAEYIWNTAYGYYLKNSGKADEKMGRDYDSAIDYADDITRRTVAGRGRGETALVQTSKLMGLVAPFQVEVNNTANLMAEQIGKRNAAGLIAVEINVYLMNSLLEAVLGDRPIGFDYISVVEDMLREAFGGGDDDDDEKKKPEAKDIAKNFAARFAGETLSSLPMGAQIAQIITAGDEKLAQKLFSEDRDPTRYGTGNIGVSGAVKAGQFVWDLFGGKYSVGSNEERWRMALDAADAIAPIVSPFGIGGRQLARTLRGAHSMVEGGVYGYDSEGKRYLKYAQGNGASDWAKAILLGQYATNAGREYVDGGFKSLSAKDTALMNIAEGLGISKNVFYDTVLGMKKKKTNKKKQEWLFANDKLTPEQKKIFDALYFGNGEEAVAAARKEADLAGAGTNKNDFYDILSGRISAKRDYGGEYEFENSGYTGKVQGQIRAAKGAEITREQLFSVLAGTKNKKLPDKMAEVYSTEGLTPEQQDKLGDIVLGDNGKGRRESYAAANVSISDRVLMEGILSDYSAQKKQTGDGEADELVKKTFIMDKLMAEGKSKYEAYRLYKIQDGKWANSVADLSDEEKKRAGAAKKQYGLSESDYVIIKNYSGLAEGEKDKYGNTVSGSNREDNIKNLAKLLHCSEEEAGRRLTIATGCAYSVEELSSSARNKLETGRKYGWTDEKWLKAANAIKLSGVTKKEEKIKVLRDAGFSASEAAGYYNLDAGNDYYKSSGSGTPYGLNSAQYDKTKYWSEKSSKSEKEVAGYFKAIKGLTKKVDIIAALEAAGMSSSEANEFYTLRRGRDSGYKAYKNGE